MKSIRHRLLQEKNETELNFVQVQKRIWKFKKKITYNKYINEKMKYAIMIK